MCVREGTALLNNNKTPGRQNNLRRSPAAPAAHCQHPAGIATTSCPPAARSFTPQPGPNRNNHKNVNKVTTAGHSRSLAAARSSHGQPGRGRALRPGEGPGLPSLPSLPSLLTCRSRALGGRPLRGCRSLRTPGVAAAAAAATSPSGRAGAAPPSAILWRDGGRKEGREGRLPWRRAPRPPGCYRGDARGLPLSVCLSVSQFVCLSVFGSVPSYHAPRRASRAMGSGLCGVSPSLRTVLCVRSSS